MTRAHFCKDCGRAEGLFCCVTHILTCDVALDHWFGHEDASLGKHLHPYFEKVSGDCWSHLTESERQYLTDIMISRRLPTLVGVQARGSLIDIPDHAAFKVIKLQPGESLEDIDAISRRVRRGRGCQVVGEVTADEFKDSEACNNHKPVYRFADGYFSRSDDLEISGIPKNDPPQLGRAVEEFIPIFQTFFDPTDPTDDEIATDFFREFISDEPEPVKVKPVRQQPLGSGARQSGVVGVRWTDNAEAWCANWQENGKSIQRYFSIAKFGEEEALRLAVELRKKMEATGKAGIAPVASRQSGHAGVWWHETNAAWHASVQRNGQTVKKSFSVGKFGDEEGLRLAVAWRAEQLNV